MQFTLHYFDVKTKTCMGTGPDQTNRQRQTENMLEIKAKDKAKVVQIIKKTLTIVKSVPPKMSQGY